MTPVSSAPLSKEALRAMYPERDGKPMSDNSEQFRWINTLFANLEILYGSDPNVFVAANNLWYPVEGRPRIRQAPDVYVVFGRPKGKRGSYQQWKEDNVPIHVVFEILSESNDTPRCMGATNTSAEWSSAHGNVAPSSGL